MPSSSSVMFVCRASKGFPPPPYDSTTAERFDRLDESLKSLTRQVVEVKVELADVKREVADVKRDVADIRERMATKVDLEATNANVKKTADGYVTIGHRLDAVADLLKLRVVIP